MSRVLHAIEKGLRIYAENSDVDFVDLLFGSTAPLGTSGETADASIGSLYLRTNGSIYQKIADTDNASDWQLNGSGSSTIGTWRPESVVALTDEVQGAGVRDMVASPFTDDDGTALPIGAFVVGKFVITDADGTPELLEITNVTGNDVTFAAASSPLVADDTFVVKNYLPDASGFENSAIVNYNGTVVVKISDIDWNFADGINMAIAYAIDLTGAAISASDSVNSAIAKLDGRSIKRAQATGVTAATTIDSVLVDSYKAVKWFVHAFEEATPANVKAFEVYALHDGTAVADAVNVDDTVYSKLRKGANFNLVLSVDLNGIGAGQSMRLRAQSSTAGVTVTARRIEVF